LAFGPWFDDTRFGVYGAPTTDVPEVPEPASARLMVARPNPLQLTTRINFTTPAGNFTAARKLVVSP